MKTEEAAVWIAGLSAVIAIGSVVVTAIVGTKSTRAARRSANAAETSANEATRANARAERAEQRAVARNDVRLRTYCTNDDLIVCNDGLDAALSTTVSITVWGEPIQHLEVGNLGPGAQYRLLSLAPAFQRATAEVAEWNEFEPVVTYTERFSWRSEGGAPHQSRDAIQHASR